MNLLRQAMMALSDVALVSKKISYVPDIHEKYSRLREMTRRVSKKTLDRADQETLGFAQELLSNPKILRLLEPEARRSVWTVSVPFESDRRKH